METKQAQRSVIQYMIVQEPLTQKPAIIKYFRYFSCIVIFVCYYCYVMNVTDEIKVLTTVVETLTPLDAGARQRIVEYACNALDIARTNAAKAVHEDPRPTISSIPDPAPSGKRKPPQQYLRDYNYKIMTKRIAVMAVYLEREQGRGRFGFKDITEAFRSAKEPKMPAYSQYGRAVIMGFLAKEGDQYYATTKAEQLVDKYSKRPTGQEES